jgi:hypothetical protein
VSRQNRLAVQDMSEVFEPKSCNGGETVLRMIGIRF